MLNCVVGASAVSLALAVAAPAVAHDAHPEHAAGLTGHPGHADDHAPIGVMGDHAHKTGEWMVSYRFMRMSMSGNRIGTDSLSPEEIVTTVPNLNPMPPTLRVVPTDMTTDMHMLGAMYGVTDRVTVMVMAHHLTKEMDHITFQGGMGTTRLGTFTTRTQGFGDTSVSALVTITESENAAAVAQFGLSLPTGSIDETDDVLTPMGTRPTLTLPYPMQLGSGTFDPFVRYTYTRGAGRWGFGAQGSALVRLQDNDEDYRLGDEFKGSVWTSYAVAPSVSLSGRLSAQSIGSIDGRDLRIAAPVQTANPAFHGGDKAFLGLGVNTKVQRGALAGHRFAAEVSVPVYQDLNGPQMESEWMATVGWQYSWT